MEFVIAAFAALAAGGGAFALLHRIFALPTPASRTMSQPSGRDVRASSSQATRFVSMANRIIPQSKTDADTLRSRLAHAGLSLSPSSYHGLTVMFWAVLAFLLALLLPLLGLPFAQAALIGVLVAAVALAAPRIMLAVLAQRRTDQIRASLPKALDLLAVSVEAGLTMERSMRLYSQEDDGPLAHEFALADREMNTLGFSRSEALQRMSERCGVEDLSLFVGAVCASEDAGSPIADVLRIQSEAAFERRRQYFEEQGNKLTSKMILPMGLFLVPAVLIAAIAPMVINIAATAGGVI